MIRADRRITMAIGALVLALAAGWAWQSGFRFGGGDKPAFIGKALEDRVNPALWSEGVKRLSASRGHVMVADAHGGDLVAPERKPRHQALENKIEAVALPRARAARHADDADIPERPQRQQIAGFDRHAEILHRAARGSDGGGRDVYRCFDRGQGAGDLFQIFQSAQSATAFRYAHANPFQHRFHAVLRDGDAQDDALRGLMRIDVQYVRRVLHDAF